MVAHEVSVTVVWLRICYKQGGGREREEIRVGPVRMQCLLVAAAAAVRTVANKGLQSSKWFP